MSDDEALYAQIRAAQAVAVEKLQQRWGQQAAASSTPAVPKEPDLIEQAWRQRADTDMRGMGITPVSDAEAAAIQEAQAAAVAKMQAEQATQMDDQLHNFRREVEHDRAAKSGLYYNEDASKMREIDRLVRETEIAMMQTRLEAGLPAEPLPRRTPAEIALERYNARRAGR